MANFRKTVFEVNLFSLAKNYAELKNEVGHESFFCPMVKANAYGHGAVAVARALSQLGCTDLGVAFIEEAISLRESQIASNIFVSAQFDKEGARAIVEYELTPILSSFESLEALCGVLSELREERFSVHVEFNTGMNRLGFAPEQAFELAQYFRSHRQIELTGLCTHLAFAEDAGEAHSHSAEALEQFYAIEKIFTSSRPITHIYSGASLINVAGAKKNAQLHPPYRWPEGVRPGLALYGYKTGVRNPETVNLRAVAQLKSQVVKYHALRPGESVSYGGTWTATHKCTIGVVPIGYGDGYPRQLSNRAFVLFRGSRVPVIGHVCMDYLMIDVTPFAHDPLKLGEDVVLWGEQNGQAVTLEELAELLGTVPYTLLTGVGSRVSRAYIQE